ncbi:MAG: glutamate--tRNA ligase family protein, partial [Pseudomonas protegens]
MSKPTVDPTSNAKTGPAVPVNFLRPPEPNGYLHIGHAKSICVNFGLAQEFGGVTHLRFDDTNPAKEDQEYIDAIESDVKWLGFEWSGEVRYASQYFDQLHD